MKNLLILPLFLLLLSFETRNKGCLEMDIVILADLSGSVEDHESFVKDAIETLIDKLDTSEKGVRVGIIGFNDLPFVIAGLQGDKETLLKLIDEFPLSGEGLTYMNLGLQVALNMIYTDRYNVQKLIIVISDGAIFNQDETMVVVNQLEAINIGICGVLIKNSSSNAQFMKDIAGICYVETSYENLAVELVKMDVCL